MSSSDFKYCSKCGRLKYYSGTLPVGVSYCDCDDNYYISTNIGGNLYGWTCPSCLNVYSPTTYKCPNCPPLYRSTSYSSTEVIPYTIELANPKSLRRKHVKKNRNI